MIRATTITMIIAKTKATPKETTMAITIATIIIRILTITKTIAPAVTITLTIAIIIKRTMATP